MAREGQRLAVRVFDGAGTIVRDAVLVVPYPQLNQIAKVHKTLAPWWNAAHISKRTKSRCLSLFESILAYERPRDEPYNRFRPIASNAIPPSDGADIYVLLVNLLVVAASYYVFILTFIATSPYALRGRPWEFFWFGLNAVAASAAATSLLLSLFDLAARRGIKDVLKFFPVEAEARLRRITQKIKKSDNYPPVYLLGCACFCSLLPALDRRISSVLTAGLILGAIPLVEPMLRPRIEKIRKWARARLADERFVRAAFMLFLLIFLLTWLAGMKLILLWDNPYPTARLHFDRVTNLTSGVSPIFPVTFLTAALVAWIYASLPRAACTGVLTCRPCRLTGCLESSPLKRSFTIFAGAERRSMRSPRIHTRA